MKPLILALSTLALAALSSTASAASFDCAKAKTVDEHAVCADPQLSELDTLMGKAFVEAKKAATEKEDKTHLATIAKVFMTQRHACADKRSCLVGAYVGALDSYSAPIPVWVDAPTIAGGNAPASRTLPAALNQCVTTQVSEVHPRLDFGHKVVSSDFDSGTGVDFANGGYQVSYSREPALIASHKGDPVVMCLISIPRNCPPGDDRGRSYTVTNMRTHKTWTLGDSQHMCGGA